jgi:hypothetical protein
MTLLAPSTSEKGITGTANFYGDLLTESNAKLIHEQAFGAPGARTWGEWEKILMTDPAVHMGVEFVVAQLRDALVQVEPADEEFMPDQDLAQRQADFVRWNLFEALEPGWSDLIQQCVRGTLSAGFCLHELVAKQVKHPLLQNGTGYRLAKMSERLPVSIHPLGWLEKDGDLDRVRQQGYDNSGASKWQTPELPADVLQLISWNRTGNNYLGHSAFRSVWYLCKIREQLAKLVGITLTREGAGVPVAVTTDPNKELSPEQRKDTETLLANLVFHENASVVMPAAWDLKWVYSPGANKGHVVDAYNNLGLVILQQVQAQQLGLGVHNTGSRAVGQTHDTSSDNFVLGVAATLEGAFNGVGDRRYQGTIPKLVRWDFGEQAAYPKLTIGLKQAKLQPDLLATALAAMRTAKCITVWRCTDENTLREKLGFERIDDDEFDAQQEKADKLTEQLTKLPPPGAPPLPPGAPPHQLPPGAPKSPAPPDEKKARRASGQAFEPRRPLRPAEMHCAWQEMDDFLDKSKESFERGAKPIVVAMLTRALPDVKSALADRDPGELADVPLDTKPLEDFIGTWLKGVSAEGYRQVASEFRKQAAAARPHMGASSDEEKDTEPSPSDEPSSSEDSQMLLEAQQRQLARRLEARIRAQLEDEGIDVIRTGGDAHEVVSGVVTDTIEAKTLQADAGVVVTKAFNMGREQFAQEHGDAIESVELSALLDDATCSYCEQHDGDEFDFDSEQHDAMTPPLRDCDGGNRCRCLLVYNFKKPGEDDGEDE